MHPPSPAQVPDLMPPGFTFTREAVRKKLGK
jgi:hypothetical protein